MAEEKKEFVPHVHADGTVHSHPHDHDHPHSHDHDHAHGHTHGGHTHTHENQRAVINRLSRAIGHLGKVKKMVEDGVDCSEVLIQLSAVRSALTSTGKVILEDHLRHCIVDAVEQGDQQTIDELVAAIEKFVK